MERNNFWLHDFLICDVIRQMAGTKNFDIGNRFIKILGEIPLIKMLEEILASFKINFALNRFNPFVTPSAFLLFAIFSFLISFSYASSSPPHHRPSCCHRWPWYFDTCSSPCGTGP
jgi:hypothetical protein